MTDNQQNQISTVVSDIESYMLTGTDVKKSFATNEIQKIFLENQDIPKRDIISYLHLIQLTGANPALKQIYLTSHFDKHKGHKVGTPVFSYHFFMAKAKETGKYKGVQVDTVAEEVFCPIKNDSKKELVSTATIVIDGQTFTFKARWSEFNQGRNQWRSKPYMMLEKCAIANLLKRAFPEAMSGLILDDEIDKREVREVENLTDISSDILTEEKTDIVSQIEVKSAVDNQEQSSEEPEQKQEVTMPLFEKTAEKEEKKLQKTRKETRGANKNLKFSLGDKNAMTGMQK